MKKSIVLDNKLVIWLFVIFMCIAAFFIGLNSNRGLDADTECSLEASNGVVQKGKSIKVKLSSKNKYDKKRLKWSVSNKRVASIQVSKSRKSVSLKGKKEGTVTVSLKYKKKKLGSVKVCVVNDSLQKKSLTLSINKGGSVQLKNYLKTSIWCKYGDISWSTNKNIVSLKPSNYGQKCKIVCKKPGTCKLTAKQGKHVVGSVTVKIPDSEVLTAKSKSITAKGNIVKIGGAEFLAKYSPRIKYKLHLSKGQYLGTSGEEGLVVKLKNLRSSIFTTEGDVLVYSYIQAIRDGVEEVILESPSGVKYNIEIDVSGGSADEKYIQYEDYISDLCKIADTKETEFEAVEAVVRELTKYEYSLGQRDKFVCSTSKGGNCVAGGLVLKDVCARLGIECRVVSVEAHYSSMPLESAMKGNFHAIEICDVDGKKIITDATPRGFSAFGCFDYEKALNNEWVFPEWVDVDKNDNEVLENARCIENSEV